MKYIQLKTKVNTAAPFANSDFSAWTPVQDFGTNLKISF